MITEHGLNSDCLENTRIPGYSLIGGFTRKHYKKGGVAIFSSLQLENQLGTVSVSEETTEHTCEIVTVKVKHKKETLFLMGLYRPPNTNLENAIDIILAEIEKFYNPNCSIILLGDINVDNLSENIDNRKLSDALSGYNLQRLGIPPTRITKHSQTSIDCVCTNIKNENITCKVITTGLSDHTAQVCKINLDTKKGSHHKVRKRIINNQTMEDMRNFLLTQDWNNVTQEPNVDVAYNNFNKILQQTIDTFCPYKLITMKRNPIQKLWDSESELLKKSYLEALSRETLTGNEIDKKETALRKKRYDLRLKDLKKKQNTDYIAKAENKQKALWKVINSERKETHTNCHLESLNVNGNLTSSASEIANHLNNYFATIADKTLAQNHKERTPMIMPTHSITNTPSLKFHCVTQAEVAKIIDTMKPKISAGNDEISSKMIKYCKNTIITPLTCIINKSLTQGKFPNCLKLAKIFPKFKSGTAAEASNYRPISLISNFSKILERVVLNQLLQHLIQHNLLTPRQHGFIKSRSTTTAIIQLIETILDGLEQGNIATTILLDFSKAFDCLEHNLINKKLETFGITEKESQWFNSYLKNRQQLVELNSKENNIVTKVKSRPEPVNRGVPQGSVLGPVLYILVANDFPKYLEKFCDTVMYADDTALIITNKTKDQLDIDSYIALNMAKQYCLTNDLVLNEKKTNQIIFTTTENQYDGLPELTTVDTNKYLGITLDTKLSWEPHINNLCRKLNSGLYVIRRMNRIGGHETSITAYYSLFEAHLRYGLVAWGGTTATNLQRILIIQKRAIRTIKGLGPQDSCREAFKELKILTVISLYILHTILHVTNSPQNRLEDQHHYDTRNKHNFILQTHHLSVFEKKPSYKGALFFNTLPDPIKLLSTTNLKNALKNWLLERSFYTVQEFMDWRRNS